MNLYCCSFGDLLLLEEWFESQTTLFRKQFTSGFFFHIKGYMVVPQNFHDMGLAMPLDKCFLVTMKEMHFLVSVAFLVQLITGSDATSASNAPPGSNPGFFYFASPTE